MIKHFGIFFITSVFVWSVVYSIPSVPIVFEAHAVSAASPVTLAEKLQVISDELQSVSRQVAVLSMTETDAEETSAVATESRIVREVPFYSQFNDISSPVWQKVGCGITSLAMIIDYFESAVPVDTLLDEGIASGAYIESAGWSHAGLIGVAEMYGLTGEAVGLQQLSPSAAFAELEVALVDGPVIASVYYTFIPGHPIPHLVVINDVQDGLVYYNDPAEPTGGGTISIEDFKPAWKQRYIAIHPTS